MSVHLRGDHTLTPLADDIASPKIFTFPIPQEFEWDSLGLGRFGQ